MTAIWKNLILVIWVYFIESALSSRILAVLPTASKSHFYVFQPLILALASRGHELTVITNYPLSSPVKNYKEINVQAMKTVYASDIAFDFLPELPAPFLSALGDLYNEVADFRRYLHHPEVRRLLDSNEKFDLLITEVWISDLAQGFAHRFQVPVVGISSCGMYPWMNDRLGNPDNPSFIPNDFFHKTDHLSFWNRLENTYQLVVSKLAYEYFFNPVSENIARNVFGESMPPLSELVRNTSILLVNTHHSLHGSRPESPQIIQVGGIHVKPSKPLPKELDEWMNSSTHGVVYLSFGSMLRGSTLPVDLVRSFLTVFASLRQRVLWKWEDDSVAGLGLPDNVRVMKWIPQRDVLAHPKTKVFISHGGLLGTTEAVVSGVPVLGIPMYGDQPNNVAAMVEKGVAIHVDYNNISETSLSYALNALIADKRYAENARELSRRFQDRPQSALETAVFWTEYVIRHKGAPHLQSAAVHMPWYQLWLLDVAAVCLVALVSTAAFVFFTLRSCLRLLLSASAAKLKTS